MAKRLRSGYTTGACAAAAAKAAAIIARDGILPQTVEIPFPDGSLHSFTVVRAEITAGGGAASVIKDAGDDPDVTNKAEIRAEVRLDDTGDEKECIVIDNIRLRAGIGIGHVTKPGLAVAAGEPAINPVPRQMISEAVRQVESGRIVQVIISVPLGEKLAKKTLNHRLGIVGGLSILGTTGIVRPLSAEAWTATIETSLNVAWETGLREIVLSTGRTSEKGAQSLLQLPVEAYAMMGDYLEFSLLKAGDKGFTAIHLAGMWAKMMKAAMLIPHTHVRHGALEIRDGAALLQECGAEGALLEKLYTSNTAREMYGHLLEAGREDIVRRVCLRAKEYAGRVSTREVYVYLVDAGAKVVEHV